jgi:hypothetical protein
MKERRRLRVLAQCKAEKKKMGPVYIRELEGVVYKHVATRPQADGGEQAGAGRPHPIVALLISQSKFTQGCILAAQTSPVPFLLLHLPESGAEGAIGSAVWNSALGSERGALGGELEMRWERKLSETEGQPWLWWRGSRLESWVPDGGAPTEDL